MPYHRCTTCGLTSYSAAAHATASLCPSCSAPLGDDSKVFVVPGTTQSVTRSLHARAQAAAEARHAVVGLALPEEIRQKLALLVTELVTNSVLHAGLKADDTVELHIDNGGAQVRVTVHDHGPGFAPPQPSPDPLRVGGHGLVVLAALSDAWGVECDADGCTVWCDVATETEPAAAAGPTVAAG